MQLPPEKATSQIPAFRRRVADQMADYRRRLAERVQHERERKSLSRDDLALRSGVSGKTVKRIEEQKVENPRPVTIRRLADALGIEPEKLRPPVEIEEDQLHRIEDELAKIKQLLADLLARDKAAAARAEAQERQRAERRPPARRQRATGS